jgi:putative FmdB family regulatory protein
VPLYEYKCLKCNRRTEKIEPVNGPHLKKCPHCGGKMEALISASAIQFKGSGWYVTDYAGKKSGSSSSSSSDSDSKDEKSASDKKDSASKDSAKESGKDSGSKETSTKETKETKDTKEKKSEKSTKK